MGEDPTRVNKASVDLIRRLFPSSHIIYCIFSSAPTHSSHDVNNNNNNNNNNNKSLYRAYTNCPKRLTIHKFDKI